MISIFYSIGGFMLKNLPVLFLIVFIFCGFVFAQPELDTTFASTGKRILQFNTIGGASDVIAQPDGKIVLFGGCFNINFGSFPFCLVRLNEDGSFDTTFAGPQGNTGYVFRSIPGYSSGTGNGIARQNDGKFVVVGFGNASGNDRFVIARFDENGSLDTSFGQSGFAINTSIVGRAYKVLIQPDGKILIVGFSGTGSQYQMFVSRYTADGAADNNFGTNGISLVNIAGAFSTGLSIALQADGKILAGGSTNTNTPVASASHLFVRMNTNGTLDNSWDGDGIKTIPYGTVGFYDQGITAVAVQGDGQILALGDSNILYRFNVDGSLDTSFDGDGSRPALEGDATAYDLTVTASGKIMTLGHTKMPNLSTVSDILLYKTARFLPNGQPDQSFSGDGFLDIDVMTSGNDGAFAMTYDSVGRTVFAGKSAIGVRFAPWQNSQFSLARLLAIPAQNVGFKGKILNSDGKPVMNAFITLRLGNDIIANTRTNNFGYFRIQNVQSARTYTFSVRAKNLNFYDQNILIDGEVTNYTIVGSVQ